CLRGHWSGRFDVW
nr:immunoglobulin heavy chain junction region [Macaca mulatta]MOV53188.1 immunoglobulin heavy chain junction region [Macaca mulatta]